MDSFNEGSKRLRQMISEVEAEFEKVLNHRPVPDPVHYSRRNNFRTAYGALKVAHISLDLAIEEKRQEGPVEQLTSQQTRLLFGDDPAT